MMSAIANFLNVQYKLGRITTDQVKSLVGKKLTQVEANKIIEGDQ